MDPSEQAAVRPQLQIDRIAARAAELGEGLVIHRCHGRGVT